MKRAYLIFLIACACAGCKPGIAVIDFSLERVAPLMFRFQNLSSGCEGYQWDFGDGTVSYAQNALHTYSSTGIYIVTLTATVDGIKYRHQQQINVTAPAVYISGVVYYNIPYESRYYKVVFKDDALLPSSWDFQTTYTPMLYDSHLPYVMMLSAPRPMENMTAHTYYTVQVIRSSDPSNSSNDAQCMRQQLKVKDLLTYRPEYLIATETGATAIGIRMEYRY